jgi:hypothetical protein
LPNPKDLEDSANTPKPLNMELFALFVIACVPVAQALVKNSEYA